MFLILLFLYLLILCLLVSTVTIVLFLIFNSIYELPYVGAKKVNIDEMLTLSGIKKGKTIIDLGSGDGRILIASAQKGANATGYEINPVVYLVSIIKVRLSGLSDKITIKKESLWKADLKKADVIFVYALRKSMPKFEDFIFKNAKKGTRIIANTNPFPSKTPVTSDKAIFLYKA